MAIIQREAAKVYQFPVQPRRRLGNGMTVPAAPFEVAISVVDSCWYHDEAVREDGGSPDKPKPC